MQQFAFYYCFSLFIYFFCCCCYFRKTNHPSDHNFNVAIQHENQFFFLSFSYFCQPWIKKFTLFYFNLKTITLKLKYKNRVKWIRMYVCTHVKLKIATYRCTQRVYVRLLVCTCLFIFRNGVQKQVYCENVFKLVVGALKEINKFTCLANLWKKYAYFFLIFFS